MLDCEGATIQPIDARSIECRMNFFKSNWTSASTIGRWAAVLEAFTETLYLEFQSHGLFVSLAQAFFVNGIRVPT